MSKKSKSSKIADLIVTIIAIIVVIKLFGIYKNYNFNGFTKAESNLGYSHFVRDSEVKYDSKNSYKIESNDFNDAIFYKKIEVKPNTPYKLSCMVKTEDIVSENKKAMSGAQISVLDTTECSESLQGTNDWQKLDFIFDSKNREEIEIGFRLGGNESNSKGTAWFSDFRLEEGVKDNTNTWNVACFIIKNVDVMIDGEEVNLSMSIRDIESMKDNIQRFSKSMNELSDGKMNVTYDTFEINEPIKTVTYSDEFAYYLDPQDVYGTIKDYLEQEEYDYIFVAVRLGDSFKDKQIEVNDWIGLRRNGYKRNWIFKY